MADLPWSRIENVSTAVVAAVALVAAVVTYLQLTGFRKSAGRASLFELYRLFDNEERREDRRRVFGELGSFTPLTLPKDLWGCVERTATALDVVGLMVDRRLVEESLIMERYMEVLINLWNTCGEFVEYRRNQKGRGWHYFEALCTRAENYRQRKYRQVQVRLFSDP